MPILHKITLKLLCQLFLMPPKLQTGLCNSVGGKFPEENFRKLIIEVILKVTKPNSNYRPKLSSSLNSKGFMSGTKSTWNRRHLSGATRNPRSEIKLKFARLNRRKNKDKLAKRRSGADCQRRRIYSRHKSQHCFNFPIWPVSIINLYLLLAYICTHHLNKHL